MLPAPGGKREVTSGFYYYGGWYRVRVICSWRSIPPEHPPLVFSPGGGDVTIAFVTVGMIPLVQKRFSGFLDSLNVPSDDSGITGIYPLPQEGGQGG